MKHGFTPGNLKKIWDRETRRGTNLPKLLWERSALPDLVLKKVMKNIESSRSQRESIRILRKTGAPDTLIVAAKESLRTTLEARDEVIEELLVTVARRINRPNFRFEMVRGPNVGGRERYAVSGSFIDQFFGTKQVQTSLALAFGLRMSNRRLIVKQLLGNLGDRFPKSIVRMDVASFYESVQHVTLLRQLEDQRALDRGSLRLIRDFLRKFSSLSDLPAGQGLPRGLGLSAYLAEVYLHEFDRQVIELPETVMYARFVDDIIAMFSNPPSNKAPVPAHSDALARRLLDLGLSPSKSLNKSYEALVSKQQPAFPTFQYLGYTFTKDKDQNLTVHLSPERVARLEKRLEGAFAAYHRAAKPSGKSARLLIQRIHFMTSNTRLENNKRNGFVGVFYSNEHLSDVQQLRTLDDKLNLLIASVPNPQLSDLLRRFGFSLGYERRTITRWTTDQLRQIPLIWDY